MTTSCNEEDVSTAVSPPLIPSSRLVLPAVPEGWTLSVDPNLEWRPQDEKHPACDYVKKYLSVPGELDWKVLPPEVTRVHVPVLYVLDGKGENLAHVRLEPRLVKGDEPESTITAVASQYWVLHRPKAAILAEEGDWRATMQAASLDETALHRALYLRARERLETEEAFAAFKVLFKHYSFNEELWRLERWMNDFLPFDLEDAPEMEQYRKMLTTQVGHLRGEKGVISLDGVSRWYATGSPPAEGIDEKYAHCSHLPSRLDWLINGCKQEGYKRVAEWGSVNGVSLFPLLKFAPDIEWYGFESNPKAVEAGRQTAEKAQVKNFNLHPMSEFNEHGPYDAIALFEALEHNDWEGGKTIVKQLLSFLAPGKSLFITTPCGNWSAFDDKYCRDLSTRKDHILAYTPSRMAKMLNETMKECGVAGELVECCKVENSSIHENNAWVYCRVKVK